MPQGKGTYGSKVGRPSKKKYQVGGEVGGVVGEGDRASLEAAQMAQELEAIPLQRIEPEFPIEDATLRSENYQLGGAVRPPTAPSMPQYKKGGNVDITDIVKSTEMRKRQLQKAKDIKSKTGKYGEPELDTREKYIKAHMKDRKDSAKVQKGRAKWQKEKVKKMKKEILK